MEDFDTGRDAPRSAPLFHDGPSTPSSRNGPNAPASPPTAPDTAPLPTRPHFHRRPTNLSERAVAKGGPTDDHHVNLEHGLDIALNCEIKQGDPGGSTEAYRLLVPPLFYQGELPPHGERKVGLVRRLTARRPSTAGGGGASGQVATNQGRGNWGQPASDSGSDVDSAEPPQQPPQRGRFGLGSLRAPSILRRSSQRRDTPPPARSPFPPRPAGASPRDSPPASAEPARATSLRTDRNGRPSPIGPISAPLERPPPPGVLRKGGPPASQRAALARHPPDPAADGPAFPPAAGPASAREPPRSAAAAGFASPPMSAPARGPPEPVAHNATVPLGAADDEDEDVTEDEDAEPADAYGTAPRPRRPGKFDARGASKFFGAGPGAGAGSAGAGVGRSQSQRSPGGYSGIEAYSERDKRSSWRKFF